MEQRDAVIRLRFDMWLQKRDLGISRTFSQDAACVESRGPEYHGTARRPVSGMKRVVLDLVIGEMYQ